MHVHAEHVRAAGREDADQARPDQPAGDDERDHEPVEALLDARHELVEALVDEADLDLAVAHLLEEVVQLVRRLAQDAREPERLLLRAREPAAAA